MMTFLDSVKALLQQGKTVRRVADDEQLTAELILLVRMMFADGRMSAEELEKFKEICATRCNIPVEDIPEVVRFLADYGYETSADNAAGMFVEMDVERKRAILRRLVGIAKSDNELDPRESLLIQKTADHLGLTMLDAFSKPPE